MICPGCSRFITTKPGNCVSISEGQEHLWGICPHCKEIMHFVHRPSENRLYGWIGSRENAHAGPLEVLRQMKHVLYIPSKLTDTFSEVCHGFAFSRGRDVGFAVCPGNREEAVILSTLHPTVVLDEVLFPELPSFIAEKILLDNMTGKLYSTEKTLSDRFEVLT